jgi:hypothetical protein
MPDQRSALYTRSRLFLAFGWSVMRHTTALLLTLIGTAILSVPAWVRPLLSPAAQRALDRWDVLPASVYPHLAETVFVIGFVLACFFAWEEERQESEKQRKEKERLEALRDQPDIVASIIHPSGPHQPDTPFDIVLRLELNNQGGKGRVDGWSLNIDSPKGPGWAILPKKTLYIDNPEGSGISPGDAVIAPPPPSSQRIPARDIVLAAVRFTTPALTWAEATEKGTIWTVGFQDNTGRDYAVDKAW